MKVWYDPHFNMAYANMREDLPLPTIYAILEASPSALSGEKSENALGDGRDFPGFTDKG